MKVVAGNVAGHDEPKEPGSFERSSHKLYSFFLAPTSKFSDKSVLVKALKQLLLKQLKFRSLGRLMSARKRTSLRSSQVCFSLTPYAELGQQQEKAPVPTLGQISFQKNRLSSVEICYNFININPRFNFSLPGQTLMTIYFVSFKVTYTNKYHKASSFPHKAQQIQNHTT